MWYVSGGGKAKRHLFQYNILFLGLNLLSCGKLPDYQVLNDQKTFVADAELNPNVDLLFVIDNSGSMERDQAVLASSFQDFITNFTSKKLQYHIGVVSTDTCQSPSCIAEWWDTSEVRYPGIYNDGMGGLLTKFFDSGNRLKFLDWEMTPMGADPLGATPEELTVDRFIANATLGTRGSGSEAGLAVVSEVINKRSGYNINFFRPGAFTAIIIVSDEDEGYGFSGDMTIPVGKNSRSYLSGRIDEVLGQEESDDTGGVFDSADQNTRVGAFIASLQTLKGAELNNFSLNVIAVPHDQVECVIDGNPEFADDFEPAFTFQRAVNDVNAFGTLGSGAAKATFTDICSNFAPALDLIGSNIVEANARYDLEDNCPNPASISVIVNSVLVPESTTNGWSYDSVNNAIQFYGTAVPAIGDSINIDYTPTCPL